MTPSMSKFISLIPFSIETIIKEKSVKGGGHFNPGDTVDTSLRFKGIGFDRSFITKRPTYKWLR